MDGEVVIVGGGNAALCAALAARELGADVLVLESAPREFRSGNSRHTRNLRCLGEAYPEDEFLSDLLHVTGGRTDEALARMTIRASAECQRWMKRRGVRFQGSLGGTLQLDRTNAFFLGGGKALMNTYYAAAERLGVRVLYDTEVTGLEISRGRCTRIHASNGMAIRPHSVVAASGGFESNLQWLKQAWGDAADNFLVRGTRYNTGKLLRALLDQDVQAVGDRTQGHCVAIDARAPKFDGGIVTRLDCVSLGIVVNRDAERFYDEGEDFWPKRYAIWGRLVALQPQQIAYAIIDSKSIGRFMPSVFPPVSSGSLAGLARGLGLPEGKLLETVNRYNAAVRPGTFDHAVLDGCRTVGLAPDKTHWATRLDTPPFLGYPLRPGITFTYLGVKVDERARVQRTDGRFLDNVFAAGEIMAGNILGQGYLAGFGMTIGTVFGRIAGKEAALVAR